MLGLLAQGGRRSLFNCALLSLLLLWLLLLLALLV